MYGDIVTLLNETNYSEPVDELPATSLIICTRNRPDFLTVTVDSILSGTSFPDELIIVDQSKHRHPIYGGEPSIARGVLNYLHCDSIGLCRALNTGVAAAHGDILVFTHDDVRVSPRWFETIVGALTRAGTKSVITGRTPPTSRESDHSFAPSTVTRDHPEVYVGRIGKDVLFPMNMAAYRSTVQAVGGFDERLGPGTPFPAAEDNDFGFRLLEAGFRIIYDPVAVVYHRAWRSTSSYVPLSWAYGVGQGAYYAKHFDLRDRYMVLEARSDLRYHLLQSVLLLRRDTLRAAGYCMYSVGIVVGATRWLLTRRRQSA